MYTTFKVEKDFESFNSFVKVLNIKQNIQTINSIKTGQCLVSTFPN